MNTPAEKIINYLQQHSLLLHALPARPELSSIHFREVQASNDRGSTNLLIFDEFEDIDKPAMLFNLCLEACEYVEESASYSEWLQDMGIRDNIISQGIYQELTLATPKFRAWLPDAPKAISDYELQFNTQAAQQLRAYRAR